MSDESSATPRDFLAVERTFLAWIRTGLALMGLGFVLARFGIFLREFSLNQPNLPSQSFGLSLWFGTVLIFLGVLVCRSRSSATAAFYNSLSSLKPCFRVPRRWQSRLLWSLPYSAWPWPFI